MNEVRTAHPDSEKLAAFAVGRLSDAESVSIEAHLAECEACRQVAADVPADSLMQLLQESSIDTRNDIVGGATPAEPPKPDSLPPLYKKVAKILTGKTESTLPFTPAKPLNVPRELEAHPRYEVLALLGSGGMGTVYKARHRLMDRLVALKVINPVLVNQPGAVERFTREVKAAAQLTAPNIVHAYDAEQAGGTHFLVMEYVEGKMLADLVKEKGSLPVGQACEYMRQTAVGLQHALERGMVHRDIKPQNLMVSTSPGSPPVVKILDFGLARFVSECAPAGATTAVGAMMGSPDYMAPEQATDAHTADARADIYSMGCTLYQLLAGQVPFPDTPLLKKLEAHRDRSAIPLNHLRADVSPELAAIVTKMMAKDPAQRYQKPAEVAAALGPFVNVEPVPKPAPVRISESMRPFYRKPAFVAAVAICLLLLGGGIFLAPYVLRVQTETGTLIITSDDPDVQIEVKSGGKTVVLFFPKEKKHIELKAGEYTIELVGGKDRLKLSTNKFKIASGENKTVSVEFVPAVAEKPAKVDVKATDDRNFSKVSSVEDLLKTREVLTVAQDGSGGFKTIADALSKVQTGQVILVKDKGPYRESLNFVLPGDVALISLVGTRIEISKYWPYAPEASVNGKSWHFGAWLNAQGNFRVSGFEWVGIGPLPENFLAGRAVNLGSAGDLIVEKCSFEAPSYMSGLGCYSYMGKPGRILVQDNIGKSNFQFVEVSGSVTIQRNWVTGVGTGLVFWQRTGSVLIRENVVNAQWAIGFNGLPEDKASPAPGIDLNIHNNVVDAADAPIAFVNQPKINCVLPKSVRIANNTLRSGTKAGVIMISEDMAKVKDKWNIGPNAYLTVPMKAEGSLYESWPTGPRDQILTKHFLSAESKDADYLRIAADSPLAKDGAGGDLPKYFGAFPPGPAPKEGDWFTRLIQQDTSMKALSVDHVLANARAAANLGQHQKSIDLCTEILTKQPGHLDALAQRGHSYVHLRQFGAGFDDLSAVLKIDSRHQFARQMHVFVCLNFPGHLDDCIASAKIYLQTDKASPVASATYHNRGTAYATTGRFVEALADYEAALKITPDDMGLVLGRAWANERLGNIEQAKADQETIRTKKPEWRDLRCDWLDFVPQPMPLSEWLQGREVITVAQKGPAEYRKIQDALDHVKPGQYIKVLDKGPYRERLVKNLPKDVGLISEVGTRIELPEYVNIGPGRLPKTSWYTGANFGTDGGFRLSGFEITSPIDPDDSWCSRPLEILASGEVVVESCRVLQNPRIGSVPAPKQEQSKAIHVNSIVFASRPDHAPARVFVQRNHLEGTVEYGNGVPVSMVVENNHILAWHRYGVRFYHTSGEWVIRNNVIQATEGIQLMNLREKDSPKISNAKVIISNNILDTAGPSFQYATGTANDKTDFPAPKDVRILNNIIRSREGAGILLPAQDLVALKDVWKLGHNCYVAEPNGMPNTYPKQPTDLILSKPFLSFDPEHADYLRIAADGPLSKGGAGGFLPNYFGAYSPGPAPKDGDWFTRLRKAESKEPIRRQLKDVVDLNKAMFVVNDLFDNPKVSHFGWGEVLPKLFVGNRLQMNDDHNGAWGDHRFPGNLDTVCEVAGTILAGPHKGWGVCLFNFKEGGVEEGIEVVLNSAGELQILPCRWIKDESRKIRPIGPIPIKHFRQGAKSNSITVILRKGKTVEVFVNGIEACDPLTLSYALDMQAWQLASLGGQKGSVLGFDSFKMWNLVPPPTPLPSVAELLKTREVLTVAQDGSGGFKTIQAALDKVQAGQVILVKGKGPYRETPRPDELPPEVALVSQDGARIEIDKFIQIDKSWWWGARINSRGAFRMSGLTWVGAPLPKEAKDPGVVLELRGSSEVVIEDCNFLNPTKDELYGLDHALFHPNSASPGRTLFRNNHFECSLRISYFVGDIRLEQNWFATPKTFALVNLGHSGRVTVRENVFQNEWGIRFNRPLEEIQSKSVPGTDLQVTNNIFDVSESPGYLFVQPQQFPYVRSVEIANNIMRSRKGHGILILTPEVLEKVKNVWKIAPNAYDVEPKGSPWNGPSWPSGPKDLVLKTQFLSVDPGVADYLRIAAEGDLATNGAGGDLPTYFGAFPPGPAPKEGDWFTRMQAAMKPRAAAFTWPVEALREGRIVAPDLANEKVLYRNEFKNPKPDGGFAAMKGNDVETGHRDGRFFINPKPGIFQGCWSDSGPFPEFAAEASGRVTESTTGQWWLEIHNREQKRAMHFRLNGEGELEIFVAETDGSGKINSIGRFRHGAIKRGDAFNKILLILKEGRIEVYVNDVAVCDPIVSVIKLPAQIALGAASPNNQAVRAEFERVSVWSAANILTPKERLKK